LVVEHVVDAAGGPGRAGVAVAAVLGDGQVAVLAVDGHARGAGRNRGQGGGGRRLDAAHMGAVGALGVVAGLDVAGDRAVGAGGHAVAVGARGRAVVHDADGEVGARGLADLVGD